MTDEPRVVAIVQARMGSTRLPGKVLMDLAGRTMLERVVDRVRRADSLDAVVVATTDSPGDDAIAELCAARSWPCFRGSEADVLDRYYQAAVEAQAAIVVRVTADCPLVDPAVIDDVVERLVRDPDVDYAANSLEPRSYPRGLDVEAVRFETLETAWREADGPESREHVTPYIYNHPERFRLVPVRNDRDLSVHRWTVDTPEDLKLVRWIFEELDDDRAAWADVVALVERSPEVKAWNWHVRQKNPADAGPGPGATSQ